MAILRKSNKEKYTTIPMHIIRDERLSLKDIGLLVSMLSLPDNWEFSENGLEKIYKNDGQTSIRSGLKKLEQCGYLIRERRRAKDGKIASVEWFLYEYPQVENPHCENQSVDNQSLENQPQYNTNTSNTKELKTKKSNTKVFVPPTFEEVEAYCRERGNKVDARKFYDYFTAGDWVDAKGNKVKNWKQKLITWESQSWDSKKGSNRTADMLENSYDMMKEWSES